MSFNKYLNDKYRKKAKIMKLRSRSWFKLDEIQKKDKIFKNGMNILDLGSSPGGWSKYVSSFIKSNNFIIACDILPMKKINGVNFIQGDLYNFDILQKLVKKIGNHKINLIMSDMSPKTCGIPIIDISKSITLSEMALNICKKFLYINGTFVTKIFQGKGYEEYLKKIKHFFYNIKIRKPNSSRPCSREIYIVAKGYKL